MNCKHIQSPGKIKRSWTLTKKLDTFAGPGEIKRREVSWTLMKKLDTFAGPGEIKRREVVLDSHVSPEEIMSREVELGSISWISFALVVTQQQCNGHCLCDSAWTAFETAATWYTSCYAMSWGHCLNILVVLAVVHCLLGLPGRCTQSSLYSLAPCPPSPPHPPFPSLISNLASVDMKQNGYLLTTNTAIPF